MRREKTSLPDMLFLNASGLDRDLTRQVISPPRPRRPTPYPPSRGEGGNRHRLKTSRSAPPLPPGEGVGGRGLRLSLKDIASPYRYPIDAAHHLPSNVYRLPAFKRASSGWSRISRPRSFVIRRAVCYWNRARHFTALASLSDSRAQILMLGTQAPSSGPGAVRYQKWRCRFRNR